MAVGQDVHPGTGGVVPRPGLFGKLARSARVTVVSAPAGSGKTVLLRSWIGEAGLAKRAAWVSLGRDDRDPQRFWLSVLDALRQTVPGSRLVGEFTAAPDLDGWTVMERLLEDLARLEDRVWLVVDDAHELGPAEARQQLEMLVMRAPSKLRLVVATRHDVRLGLHRLRQEGELTEIRAVDLRFSPAEARTLFGTAGVVLSESALTALYERTEGWAAGLRLAALSLSGHPDPERFAAEFSGSERTLAEYLLAEVLERQPEEVRRLLLRTSLLERVNGELADLLTGTSGGERVLRQLEEANAFVVSADAARTWFRYHRLFADLLQLELRRTAPDEAVALHLAAARWLAARGHPIQAIRHAQAARDWPLAAQLLADHWPRLYLSGQAATVHALLSGFPARARAADAELAALTAADELAQGSLEAAELYPSRAEQGLASLAAGRRERAPVLLGMVRLLLARQSGNRMAVIQGARALQALTAVPDAARPCLGEELRALALINLGISEFWADLFTDAERHLVVGIALAHRIGRPFLELSGRSYQATIEMVRSSYALAVQRGLQAIELAERHGWTDEPAACGAHLVLGSVAAWQGRFAEAAGWVERAERAVRAEADPGAALAVSYVRGLLEVARGRDTDAVAALRSAERLAEPLAAPHLLVPRTRALLVHALVHLGDLEAAERVLAGLSSQERECGYARIATARLRLAQRHPRAATVALSPVLDESVPVSRVNWLAYAFLLDGLAADALGDPSAAGRALERALDLAAPDNMLVAFALCTEPHERVPYLLRRHGRQGTAHAALIAEILSLMSGQADGNESPAGSATRLAEPLSQGEIRVLRYLPTHLSAPEIARELSLSVNTVRTHMRHLSGKLGARGRSESVARARALGLLAPSPAHPDALHPLVDRPVVSGASRLMDEEYSERIRVAATRQLLSDRWYDPGP